jgi:hypothetical protein
VKSNKALFYQVLVLVVCGITFAELISDCDVVIIGGSTSALSAAFAAATNGVKTCLLEPTNWIGGQLTASGVPAIDFSHVTRKAGNETFPVYKYARAPENLTPLFTQILNQSGNTGRCWVSIDCYLPKSMLENALHPLEQKFNQTLRIFRSTVIKRAKIDPESSTIISIDAIQRHVKSEVPCEGYERLLHEDLPDWYSEQNSTRYRKRLLSFTGKVFIDGSDWGELLALSKADYIQGLAEKYDGDASGEGPDRCGQSMVFGFAEEYLRQDPIVPEPPNPYPVEYPDYYQVLKQLSWDQLWTYRRLYSTRSDVSPGDISLQNVNYGNDNQFGYLFQSRTDTKKMVESDQWQGGIDMAVLKTAEYLSFGWHYFYKANNTKIAKRLFLNKDVFGTCHGLVKVPYIRDTRRSIGINDFVLKITDLSGDFRQSPVSKIFEDRIAIGNYPADIHSIKDCKFPDYMNVEYQTLPFYIPFRALTNRSYKNLLVSGKTMAQSFMANSATRLHPIEWATGTAAGVSAAFMVNENVIDTKTVLARITQLQALIKKQTPITWTIEGKKYPAE